MRLGEAEAAAQIPSVSTGSVGLDLALGIGVATRRPGGRDLHGQESSVARPRLVAERHQLRCRRWADRGDIIDAEHALEIGYAKKLGWPRSKTLLVPARHR